MSQSFTYLVMFLAIIIVSSRILYYIFLAYSIYSEDKKRKFNKKK